MFDLTTRDIKYLSGVGPQRAALLNKELGIFSLHDLLYYFPYKYVDRSRIYAIREIDGSMPYIQLKGEILGMELTGEGRGRRLIAHFSDGTGVVDLVWFQGIKYVVGKYKVHKEYIVFGKPTPFNGRFNIAHPDIEEVSDLKLSAMGLQPYYNTTERMKRTALNSRAIERMMSALLGQVNEPLPETLSQAILTEHHLMPLTDALRNIHFPASAELLRKAQYRLKFEELFYVQLNILRYAQDRQRRYRGYVFGKVGDIFNKFYSECLPFELTNAQKRVLKEIRQAFTDGNIEKAAELTRNNFNGVVAYESDGEEPSRFGSFTTAGEFRIETGLEADKVENYVRSLSLDSALAQVTFQSNGIQFKREYFVSYPAKMLVMRFAASQAGKQNLHFTYVPNPVSKGKFHTEGKNGLCFIGRLDNNQMEYVVRIQAIAKKGKVKSSKEGITIDGADEVMFLVTADTDYKMNFESNEHIAVMLNSSSGRIVMHEPVSASLTSIL